MNGQVGGRRFRSVSSVDTLPVASLSASWFGWHSCLRRREPSHSSLVSKSLSNAWSIVCCVVFAPLFFDGFSEGGDFLLVCNMSAPALIGGWCRGWPRDAVAAAGRSAMLELSKPNLGTARQCGSMVSGDYIPKGRGWGRGGFPGPTLAELCGFRALNSWTYLRRKTPQAREVFKTINYVIISSFIQHMSP